MKKKRERASLTEKEERVLSLTLSSSSLNSVQVSNDDLTLCQRCSVSQHALYNGGNNLVDRISYLPDDFLCHILSFLPTKLAFTTSVLSKRWIPLCYSLPVLRFDHENEESYTAYHKFCRIVDTIMLSPRFSTNKPLKMFHLMCPYRHNNDQNSPFNVTKWLEAAKQRSVEEFHLTLNYQKLNPNILVSQTLVILKLKKLEIDSDTSCVDLPSLKTLNLEYIFFRNDNDYMNFLYACPNLESLHLETIKIDSYMKHDENNVPKEGLKSLTLSKLVRANIDSMDVLFNGIDNVEFLRITKGLGSEEFSLKAIPLFSNLIHIELLFWNHSLHCWDGVVELLHHSPKLQILYIKKWKKTSSSMEWKCPISVPECLSSHLRSCTILNFHGSANDLRFAKYILQNASLLQNMTVDVAIGSSNGLSLEKGQIMEELSSYIQGYLKNVNFHFN